MSSVLDIQYKEPLSFGGSAYASFIEQGLHLEGISKKKKLTYQLGFRNKSNKSLLSSQETVGDYIPSSTDFQSFLTYRLNDKWQLQLLGILSSTQFNFIPQSAIKTAAIFTPFYASQLALDINFQGQEKDAYSTNMAGFSAINKVNDKLTLKWMLQYFNDNESENTDIGASYQFGETDFNPNSSTNETYGQIINPLGAGYYQDYSRNKLNIDVWNASHKGYLDLKKHFIQWGVTAEINKINYKIYEWEFQDSAGYSLPVNTNYLNSFINSNASLNVLRLSGFAEDNINLSGSGENKKDVILQVGLRYNYNNLNNEFFVSPRAQLSIKPKWNKNLVIKFAAGSYNQPPFYRELMEYDGSLNTKVLSQKSVQFVSGLDYNFKQGDRPFRLTTEAYYKNMWDVNPYDINNVQITYFGMNDAKAYAYGLESRLYGELVKGAESWLSLGFMKTMENINNFYYYQYENKEGQIITAQSTDQAVSDSIKTNVGWVRRPTDHRVSMGLFLQDYLSTNENFKVHLSIIYNSNTPFNIPNSVRYRNAMIIPAYIRTDIGFSALLLSEKTARKRHSPFREFKNIWASLEIFNLINRANVISYQLIKDYANDTYAIPNTLTPRLINLKLVTRF